MAPLGAGGMGEVYRARDTRLDRTVAIKVLADALTGDPQLRQRLIAEARAISQLAHPHICTLHDIGDHQGTTFLVMEFLDGETLADRIGHGQAGRAALGVAEALEIGIQIGEALALAHRQGIVHRDLKPGNVMLARTPSTRTAPLHAKLLDFGLAKTRAPMTAAGGATALPTTPPQAVTAQGTLLGTFNYMAPEQLEGGEADARSDLFALGCVLFEMLTGRKAFDGRSAASIMAALLEREPPPVTSLRADAPPLVDDLVRRCLAKNPDERWQSAADVVVALRWAKDAPQARMDSGAAVLSPAGARRARARRALILVLGGAIAGAAVMSGLRARLEQATALPVTRFEILPPPEGNWSPGSVSSSVQLALSPAGDRLAYVAAVPGSPSQIWVRPLDAVQAQPVAGTEGASFPFWSPDGRSLGFFADRKLKTIGAAGGSAQVIGDAPAGRGATWSEDDIILFTPTSSLGIHRVPAGGGAVTAVTTLAPGEIAHYWPQFLPGGRRFLFYAWGGGSETQGIHVGALDSTETTRVLPTDGMARYVVGHLLFVRDGNLFAQPVDDRTLLPSGGAERVADPVGHFVGSAGYAAFTSAANGTLAYGPSVNVNTRLVWHDRGGSVVRETAIEGGLRSPRLSPDETSVAVTLMDPRGISTDIWLADPARGTLSRLTSDPRVDWLPIWSGDGAAVLFASTRRGASNIYRRVVGKGDDALVIPQGANGHYPTDITPDGALLAVQAIGRNGYDLHLFDLRGAAGLRPFLVTPFNEVQARISPDGKWIAFSSDESGTFQVYVRQLSGDGVTSPISIDGGMQPEWRRDGRELFYVSPRGELMSVAVNPAASTFSPGTPSVLFKIRIPEASAPYANDYAVSADGKRFLVNTTALTTPQPVTIVMNWASALNARR